MPIVSLLVVALMIFALVDIITRDDAQVKHLPKLVWIIIVILLPLIGSILWFAIGREYGDSGIPLPNLRRQARDPGTATQTRPSPPVDTRSTEQQLADLEREIEEWRLRQEIEKRRRGKGEGGTAEEA